MLQPSRSQDIACACARAHSLALTSLNQVSSFTFPLETSKPFFALSSSTGVVGLLQMPDDSLEWFQATAANGKLDISRRSKTPLASYGGLSQGMVQVQRVAHHFCILEASTSGPISLHLTPTPPLLLAAFSAPPVAICLALYPQVHPRTTTSSWSWTWRLARWGLLALCACRRSCTVERV